MMKKFVVPVVCGAILTVCSLAMAADVVVTKNGKKYHAPSCGLIVNKQTTTIDEQQAIDKGLSPCSKCLKSQVKQEVKK